MIAYRTSYQRAGSGRNPNRFIGLPPTGKQATLTGIVIGRFEGGQFAGGWLEFVALGILQQLGVVPVRGKGSFRERTKH